MTLENAMTIERALQGRFGGTTAIEEVSAGRYRFAVVSSRFDGIGHLARQDLVWEIVDTTVTREVSNDISMILPLSPAEEPVALS